MNCATAFPAVVGPSGMGRVNDFADSEPQPGPSWRDDSISAPLPTPTSSSASYRRSSAMVNGYGSGGRGGGGSSAYATAASAALSVTSLAVVERNVTSSGSMDRSVQQVPTNNLTRVQASKSSSKIILDDQQTGYLAVVPPDVERDLVCYQGGES